MDTPDMREKSKVAVISGEGELPGRCDLSSPAGHQVWFLCVAFSARIDSHPRRLAAEGADSGHMRPASVGLAALGSTKISNGDCRRPASASFLVAQRGQNARRRTAPGLPALE